MRITAQWGAAVAALFPIPLVVAMGSTSISADLVGLAFAAAVVSLASALVIFSFRRSLPQYTIEKGSGAWVGVVVLGITLYLAGSFLGEHVLQWGATPLVYLGSVAFLGGRRLAGSLLSGVLAIGVLLPVRPFLVGIVLYGVIAAVVGIAVAIVLVASRLGVLEQQPCEYCRSCELRDMSFCDYCGRKLAQRFEVDVSGRRLGGTVAFSLIFVLLLGVTLPVLSLSGTGLHVADYGLAGVGDFVSLPSAPGWSASFTGQTRNGNATTFDYVLTDGPTQANATLVLSSSTLGAEAGAVASYPGATPVGVTVLPDGVNATQFVLEQGGTAYNGLLVGADTYYLLVGQANQARAYYFYVWPSATPKPVVADGVMQVVGLSSAELARAGEAGSIVVSLFSLVQTNEMIAFAVCSVGLVAAIGAVAGGSDNSRSKKLDNSLGLGRDELAILNTVGARGGTGRAIAGSLSWDKLAPKMYKLQALGLLQKQVVAVRGAPRMLWRSGVS